MAFLFAPKSGVPFIQRGPHVWNKISTGSNLLSALALDGRAIVYQLEPASLVYAELEDFAPVGKKRKFEFLDRLTLFDGYFS